MHMLAVPVQYNSCGAADINNDSITIGRCSLAGTTQSESCIWHGGEVRALDALINSRDVHISRASSISDTGIIAAEGTTQPGSGAGFLLVPIVRPASDITGDCRVNIDDLFMVINEWGNLQSLADINHDGIVNLLDLNQVIQEWTSN